MGTLDRDFSLRNHYGDETLLTVINSHCHSVILLQIDVSSTGKWVTPASPVFPDLRTELNEEPKSNRAPVEKGVRK